MHPSKNNTDDVLSRLSLSGTFVEGETNVKIYLYLYVVESPLGYETTGERAQLVAYWGCYIVHVASSPLNSSVVFAVMRLFSRWFQSMAVLMNKEFLYYSVLGCSTTTARVLFLTCEFTMFVVSQSWNVLALMCRLGFWWLIYS